MQKTLHIKLRLRQADQNSAELRYFSDNPNDYTERFLDLASVRELLDDAETGYYTFLPADLAKTGQSLYHWLDSADRFLARAIADCKGTAEVLVLAISAEGKLSHLPWELLHDGTGFLVQKRNPSIVPMRWQDQKGVPAAAANRPLRVLFMASSPLNAEPVLDFEHEEGLILKATQKHPLCLTVEESGNLDELGDLVKFYEQGYFDIFHLTGHADISDEGPCFLTETETGSVCLASAEDIGNALSRMPKLIFLSGCRTGESGSAGSVPSLAEKLLHLGANAVLGWGRPVSDKDASQAAAELYGALSTGDELGSALAGTYQSLIERNARDWHLLRLYVAGEMSGPMVTPLRTRGRERIPRSSAATRFLDRERRVRVPTRESFVGRRRPLQRCLNALRFDADTIGVLIHGMGGLGKSSLASRLCDRMGDSHKLLVWVGQMDEHRLAKHLGDELRKPLRDLLMNPDEGLKFRLRDVFEELETPYLLVLDDFEANFEHQGNQPVLRDGLPVLSTDAKTVLEALAFAIRKTDAPHRLILTSRYDLNVEEAGYFFREHLPGLQDADVVKKVSRLERVHQKSEIAEKLKPEAVRVADRNPRLLEWLFEILGEKGLDHEKILERMGEKETEFRENILAEELLRQQDPELRKVLGLASVYELPVPYAAITAVCQGIADLESRTDRAAALGLTEVTPLPDERIFRVSRILLPLLEGEMPEDREGLCRTGARVLYEMWWKQAKTSTEEQRLEIHRLALAGKEGEIAANIAHHLGNQWNNRSRFREVVNLCKGTLKIAEDDYRPLHQLAKAEKNLGDTEKALEHYQQALQSCPDEDEKEKAAISHNMAVIYATQGEIKEALRLYQASLEIQESIGDVQGKAATLAMMGQLLASEQSDFETALAYLQESLTILEHLRSPDADTVKQIMAQVQHMALK